MSVTFTTNIGLAKPTESELAKNWATATELADDNNQIIISKANIQVVSYAAVLIGPSTNPNVGAGSITAEYIDFQKIIFGEFVIKFTAPGVADGTGTGAYGISLPFLADNTFHTVGSSLNDNPGNASCIGEGYFVDSSAVNTSGMCALDVITTGGVSYARMMPEAYTGKTVRFVGPSAPVALADGDGMTGSFIYKRP